MTVNDYVNRNKEQIVKELSDFVRIPGLSSTGECLEESADFLQKLMENAGIKTQVFPTSTFPVVYGEIKCGDDSKPTVLVYGHYDVQPPEPLELWKTPPFEPTIIDGVMYGRGSTDNKGYNIAYIRAVQALLEVDGKLPCNIKFIFEGCEENGSIGLEEFFVEYKDLLKAEYTIMTDGPRHDTGRPWMTLGCKGLLYMELTLKTMNKDVHSANAPALPSAAWEMVRLLNKLVDENGNVLVPGFYDGILEITPLEKEIMSKVPPTEDATRKLHEPVKIIERQGMTFEENMIFSPTFNISGLWSGYTGSGTKTVLASIAKAKFDIRLVPFQNGMHIAECVRKYIKKLGYDNVDVDIISCVSAAKTPVNVRAASIVRKASIKAFGVEPVFTPIVNGTGPFYLFTDVLGQPIVFFRYSDEDCNNHAPNEKMTLDLLYKGIVAMSEIYRLTGETE